MTAACETLGQQHDRTERYMGKTQGRSFKDAKRRQHIFKIDSFVLYHEKEAQPPLPGGHGRSEC